MNKYFKIALLCIPLGLLRTVHRFCNPELKVDSEDNSVQQEFNVLEKTLTIKQAKAQKTAPYPRSVIQNGQGENAKPISEKLALSSKFPAENDISDYRIGVGDTITFSRLIENNRSPRKTPKQWPTQLTTSNYKLGIGDTLTLTLLRAENFLNQINLK